MLLVAVAILSGCKSKQEQALDQAKWCIRQSVIGCLPFAELHSSCLQAGRRSLVSSANSRVLIAHLRPAAQTSSTAANKTCSAPGAT
jgi:hypothetical protein